MSGATWTLWLHFGLSPFSHACRIPRDFRGSTEMPPGDQLMPPMSLTALLCHGGQRWGQGRAGAELGKDAETPRDPGWARHRARATPVGTRTVWDAGPLHPRLHQENWESSALPRPSWWLAPALPESSPGGMPGWLLHQRSCHRWSPGCCWTWAWTVPDCECRGRAGCRNAT